MRNLLSYGKECHLRLYLRLNGSSITNKKKTERQMEKDRDRQETRHAGFYSMCVLGLTWGQTIKEHLKRWQSSARKKKRGGVCRCMKSMCFLFLYMCMCAHGNACVLSGCTIRSRKVFLWRVRNISAFLHLRYSEMLVKIDKRQQRRTFHYKEEENREREREKEHERERETMWRTALKEFLWGHNKGPSENTVA